MRRKHQRWTFIIAQLTLTFSKSVTKKLEKGVKYVQNSQQQQKKPQNDVIDFVLVFLLLTSNVFYTFSSFSIFDFEQVNVSWVKGS